MSTTSTVLLNLNEWLMLHTWIIWYLGADTGHQLVFQVEKHEGAPTHGRWAGYAPYEPSTMTSFTGDHDVYGRPLDTQISLAIETTTDTERFPSIRVDNIWLGLAIEQRPELQKKRKKKKKKRPSTWRTRSVSTKHEAAR